MRLVDPDVLRDARRMVGEPEGSTYRPVDPKEFARYNDQDSI